MAHRIDKSGTDKSSRPFFWGSVVLAILGALDATYLLVFKLTGNSQMCLGNGGCHDVNFSPYSEIYRIPISVFGISAFLAILCILFLESRLKIANDFFSLPDLSRALRYLCPMPVLRDLGNSDYLVIHSGHHPVDQTNH
jgi:uncharacterized membrane protein